MKPNNYNYEVLIVDDDLNAAQDYVELVNSRTSLSCICTSDSEDAKSIMAYCDIKIVILDQKMPQITGTELLPILKTYNNLAKFIMLTGEATKEELGEAVNKGFSAYVKKEKVLKELAQKVVHFYIQYEKEFNQLLKIKSPKFLHFYFTSFMICRLYKIEDNIISKEYEDEKRSQVVASIHEGQIVAKKFILQHSDEYVIESGNELGFFSQFQHPKWMKSINAQIKNTFNKSIKKAIVATSERQEEYELPKIDDKRILKRELKWIPIYEIHKMFFGTKLLIGGKMRIKAVVVRIFTHSYREVQVDYYEALEPRVNNLGKVYL
mgnify:FL=1